MLLIESFYPCLIATLLASITPSETSKLNAHFVKLREAGKLPASSAELVVPIQ